MKMHVMETEARTFVMYRTKISYSTRIVRIFKKAAPYSFERLPNEWFRQHYPKYEFMRDDITTIDQEPR